jgi:serine protease Do
MEETMKQMVTKKSNWALGVGLVLMALSLGVLAGSVTRYSQASRADQQDLQYAKSLSKAFRDASNQVLPAVVDVTNMPKTTKVQRPKEMPEGMPRGRNPFKGTPFEDMFEDEGMGPFFREMPRMPRGMPRGPGAGSGVIIDPDGIILTNRHVVAGNGDIRITLHDGRQFEATEVLTDPKTDLAIVKIDAKNLPHAPMANSDEADVGDWVLALGQPFGLQRTVTAGIISAKSRGIGITARENFIQTDAAINPGNSGGPLVNLNGEVVGINTAIESRSGGYQGIGFAIPSNLAHWVANQLIKTGKVQRAYLGVSIQPMTHELAEKFGTQPKQGVLISGVQKDTPAAKAGLKPGDVILEFGGEPINNVLQLQGVVERAQIGQDQTMVVLRDGKRRKIDVVCLEQPKDYGISEMPGLQQQEEQKAEEYSFEELGIDVQQNTEMLAEKLGIDTNDGVVISGVEQGSPAQMAGLRTGMVILEANRQKVNSPDAFRKAIEEHQGESGILLLLQTKRGTQFVVIEAK